MNHLHLSAPHAPGRPGPFISGRGGPLRFMNWLFAGEGRAFWFVQIVGWFLFFLLHYFSLSASVLGRRPEFLNFSIASTVVGFLATSFILRPIFLAVQRRSPAVLLATALVSSCAVAVAIAVTKALLYTQIIGPEWIELRQRQFGTENPLLVILPDLPANFFIVLAWAGFFFGVNYYLTLRNETERALKSARLADQAQLKMLRYQLNPHFLFNTLNAVSTLVLEDNKKNANDMLTRLSAFLRYSLDSDPLQKTTLSEELRALDLYLAIEKARFENRLEVARIVDEEALGAFVPSMILQPAIENAIKYAIAQQENGGRITIEAKRVGERIHLSVCDDGPGAQGDPDTMISRGTGVGLANMRERLAHLYGANQSFRASNREPRGFCVAMEIPFEPKGGTA